MSVCKIDRVCVGVRWRGASLRDGQAQECGSMVCEVEGVFECVVRVTLLALQCSNRHTPHLT